MSTALTSSNQPSKQPVEIVVILRFLLGVQRRCAVNVSTVDTVGASQLFPRHSSFVSSLSLQARPAPSWNRTQAGVSDAMTL